MAKCNFCLTNFIAIGEKISSKVILNSFNINVNIVLICNDILFDRSVFI